LIAIVGLVVAINNATVAINSYNLNYKLVDSQLKQFEIQNNLTNRTIELMNLQYDFETSPDVYFTIKPKKWQNRHKGGYTVDRDTFLSDPTIEIIVGNSGFKPIYVWSVSSYDDCSDVKGSRVVGLLDIEGMQNAPIKPHEDFNHTTDLLKNVEFDKKHECTIYFDLRTNVGTYSKKIIMQN
jgi:hypothetical protein